MSTPQNDLNLFLREALAAGHDPAQITHALQEAGWSAKEAKTALAAWHLTPELPPIPRPRAYLSAREALIYGLLFISLGLVAWYLNRLGFQIIDRLLPDPAEAFPVHLDQMRWSIAMLLGFMPTFLLLNRVAARATRAGARSLVRRWFASATLLISSLTLLGTLVYTIYALLSGDLSLRFGARIALVALVAGLVVAYYRDELDG